VNRNWNVVIALVAAAVIFQLFLRYQYIHTVGQSVERVDRLTGQSCLNSYRMRSRSKTLNSKTRCVLSTLTIHSKPMRTPDEVTYFPRTECASAMSLGITSVPPPPAAGILFGIPQMTEQFAALLPPSGWIRRELVVGRGRSWFRADTFDADLSNADLRYARLMCANLRRAKVPRAKLAYVNLAGASYTPESEAPDPYVACIRGLSTVQLGTGDVIGLVQLRKLLQDAGLRDSEREATYSIERGRTRNLLQKAGLLRDGRHPDPNPLVRGARGLEAAFRIVAFDWTTAPVAHCLSCCSRCSPSSSRIGGRSVMIRDSCRTSVGSIKSFLRTASTTREVIL
jgi:Pentapeptide repeats (8 copies)